MVVAEAPENELAPGTPVLGRYQIIGKLAQGGMAEVYLARQSGPAGYQKLVVIKRVRPHLSKDDDFVGMFVNEARLAAMINHPNVVQIFDLGDEDGGWFLVMEYLDGRDMLQVGRACRQHNKAVPFDVTARIIADACSGLEHAHHLKGQDGTSLDLVHRDMSPENIIITFEGQVKVVDFGIAKARDNSIRTQAGQIKGKLGYVAPEAILGKGVDARADIFAIGATLYLFLSGRPAFSGTTPMEIFERSLKPPASPAEVNSRVPPALDEICMKALAQDRDKRYQSAGEVRVALDAYLASTGRPLGPPQLSQFMRILFPADKDPVRQRVDKMLGDAAQLEPPRSSPRSISVPAAPASPLSPQAAGAPHRTDPERTAIVAPSSKTSPRTEAPRAVDLDVTAQGPPEKPAKVASHLRSVGVSAAIPERSLPGVPYPTEDPTHVNAAFPKNTDADAAALTIGTQEIQLQSDGLDLDVDLEVTDATTRSMASLRQAADDREPDDSTQRSLQAMRAAAQAVAEDDDLDASFDAAMDARVGGPVGSRADVDDPLAAAMKHQQARAAARTQPSQKAPRLPETGDATGLELAPPAFSGDGVALGDMDEQVGDDLPRTLPPRVQPAWDGEAPARLPSSPSIPAPVSLGARVGMLALGGLTGACLVIILLVATGLIDRLK